jgi:hypothetical protein
MTEEMNFNLNMTVYDKLKILEKLFRIAMGL